MEVTMNSPDPTDHDELLDTSRLTPHERELWEELRDCGDGPVVKLNAFAQICVLWARGTPKVVSERLEELDPDDLLGQYLENLRRARSRGEI
jgi:hypothetical protein